MAVKNAVLNYEQAFYLSGMLMSGVTSIDGSYSIRETPVNILGKGYTYPILNAPLVGNFSIQKYYIGEEPLLKYAGDSPISGSINFGNKSFGFNSGYLTSFELSCSIGQIPRASAQFSVYGNLGSGINAEGLTPHPEIQIPNQGSITLNTTGYENNRITDFNYSLEIERSPVYKIGSPHPVQVDRKIPFSEKLSISMDVNDHEILKLHEYLIKPQQQNLNLILKNPISNSVINTFNLKKARLVSNSISTDSDGMMRASLNYECYTNSK